jgi:hypothetical protein
LNEYILYNPRNSDANTNTNKLPSKGNPGGVGGIGGGGLLDAKDILQHNNPAKNNNILVGLIFIGRKSKKKNSVSKFFIL